MKVGVACAIKVFEGRLGRRYKETILPTDNSYITEEWSQYNCVVFSNHPLLLPIIILTMKYNLLSSTSKYIWTMMQRKYDVSPMM